MTDTSHDERDEPQPATTPTGSPTATSGGPLAGPPATGKPEDELEEQGSDERAG
jgi:hypothetical protein